MTTSLNQPPRPLESMSDADLAAGIREHYEDQGEEVSLR